MAAHLAASAESRSGPSCEKESEVRSENDSEEEETYRVEEKPDKLHTSPFGRMFHDVAGFHVAALRDEPVEDVHAAAIRCDVEELRVVVLPP